MRRLARDGVSARRLLSVLGVAALLVTAGCGGLLGGDGAPGDQTGPPFDADRLPDGVQTDGSVNATQLVAAHDAALSGESFTLEYNLTQAFTTENQTREVVAVQRTRVDGEGQYVTSFRQSSGVDLRQTTWGNESVAVSRVNATGGTSYRRLPPERVRGNLSGRAFLQQFLSVGSYTVESASEDRVVLTAEAPSEDAAAQLGPRTTSVDGYDGRVVVDGEGRVQSFEGSIAVTLQQDVQGEITVAVALSDRGSTTVERPEWVSEALAQTDAPGALAPLQPDGR